MALKALIFDCDGVLADTERDGHRVAFNKAFAEHGIDAAYAKELQSTRSVVDPEKDRETRHNALRDLRAAGHPDYNSMLRVPA